MRKAILFFMIRLFIALAIVILSPASIAGPPTKYKDGLSTTVLDVDNVRIDGNTISTTNSNGDLTFDLNGTGSVIFNDLNASTVLTLDASKKLKSSTVSPTTLSYLDISSSLTSLLAAKAPLNSPTFITPTADVMTFDDQSSTPATPAAGYYKLYAKTDGKFYSLDSSGTETKIGTGSGSGGINFITNPDAESDTNGWAVYADAAGTSPVDGTGGTAHVTLTRNTVPNNPIRGQADFKFDKDAANRQGEGFSTDFDVDVADTENVSRSIYITADYITGSGFTQGDIKLFVYDVTGTLITPTCNLGDNTLPATNSLPNRLTCTFNTVANHKSYRLIGHIATTNATAWSMWYDTVKAEPTVGLPGLALTQQSANLARIASLAANTTLTGALTGSSGSGVFSYNSGTGVYSMLKDGEVSITCSMRVGATQAQASISVSSSFAGNTGGNASVDFTSGTVGAWASSTWSGHLIAGDTFSCTNSSGVGSSDQQYLSVTATAFTTNFMSSAALNAQTPDPTKTASSVKTPGGSSQYQALTGNSVTVTTGVWDLEGYIAFSASGSPAYSYWEGQWTVANGADTGTLPTSITAATSTLDVLSGGASAFLNPSPSTAGTLPMPKVRIRVKASSATIYLVPYSNQTTSSAARTQAILSATKVPDFTVYGAYQKTIAGKYYLATTTGSLTGNQTLSYTVVKETQPMYNGSYVTIPEDGWYQYDIYCWPTTATGYTTAAYKVGSGGTIIFAASSSGASGRSGGSALEYLTAGTQFYPICNTQNAGAYQSGIDNNGFSIRKVGN